MTNHEKGVRGDAQMPLAPPKMPQRVPETPRSDSKWPKGLPKDPQGSQREPRGTPERPRGGKIEPKNTSKTTPNGVPKRDLKVKKTQKVNFLKIELSPAREPSPGNLS